MGIQRGGVALMLLVILGMVAVISGATILFVNRQFTQTVNQEQEEQAFHVAEAGVNVIIFGLNESVFTTEGLVQLETLMGEVTGSGSYTLTFSPVNGSLPGQNVRVLSHGRDTTGKFCQALEVVIHRTDEARQQFVVDQWDHLSGCEGSTGTGGGGTPTASPTSSGGGGGSPSGSPSGSPTATPSGGGSPTPTASACTDDSQCSSGSCHIPSGQSSGTCDQVCIAGGDCSTGVCTAKGLCAQPCTTGSQCASASCNPSTGVCNDTCTDNSQCSSGSCDIPFDPGFGGGTCGQGCSNNYECPSGICLPNGLCGQRCAVNGQCDTNSCNPLSGTCNNSCTGDSDCASGQGCTNGLCTPFICLPDCNPVGYPLQGICDPGTCLQLVIDVSENPPIPPGDPRPECQGVSSDTCYPTASFQVCCTLPTPTPTPTVDPDPGPSADPECVECGNGQCESGENFDNCFEDCPFSCNGAACDPGAGEGATFCPDDCGLGISPTPVLCPTPDADPDPPQESDSPCNANRLCEPGDGENATNCPSDCFCGDLICEASEVGSCPECGPVPTSS